MQNLKVDDGRLIRRGWSRTDCEINFYIDNVELYIPETNQGYMATLRSLHYPTDMPLLKYALRGFLDRVGGPSKDPKWGALYRQFVSKWCMAPVNYSGWPALEWRMHNEAPIVAQFRQFREMSIEVSLVMYIGDLAHSATEVIHIPEILQRLGISPLPLGRDMHAVYSLLSHIVTNARAHNWELSELSRDLAKAIAEWEYSAAGTDPAGPEVREWEGVMGYP